MCILPKLGIIINVIDFLGNGKAAMLIGYISGKMK